MLLKVFFIYLIFLIFKIFAEHEYCEPDNEFESEQNFKLWEEVMKKLDGFTFKNNYNASCKNDTSKTVKIDANGDFLWNMRFKLYNETSSEDHHTLQDCYSVGNIAIQEKCDTEKFRNCMYSVRQGMLVKLVAEWESEIQNELGQLAKDC